MAEFGDSPSWDSLILSNQLLEEERHRVGFAFWTWKENGGSGSWGVFDPASGCLRGARERLLARVYPRASSDPNLSYHYDSATGGFSLTAIGRAGDAATVVSIPPEVRGSVTVSGAGPPETQTNPDGNRLVTASPSGGAFSITVAPAPPVLGGCG